MKKNLIFLVTGAALVIGISIATLSHKPACELQYNVVYELKYLNGPTTYKSDTDKVIWLKNGCGYNIEDQYRINDSAADSTKCTVTMIEENGGPFFVLGLPEDVKRFCSEKPLLETLVPVK